MAQTEKVRLNLPLLLPDGGHDEECLTLLTEWVAPRKGVESAHIVTEGGEPRLCVHYDPNQLSIPQIERLGHEVGIAFGERYRHEQMPFALLKASDSAIMLTSALEALPGMLHANVNYAAGLVSVAYDSTVLKREQIEATLRAFNTQVVAPPAHGEEEEEHGSAPPFLPLWVQERWALILVALAGLFLLAGWLGETFFGMPPALVLTLYLLAYGAGGYDVATHAIPSLFRGNFNTDVLMLAAAAGAAVLGEWGEGALLLFLFALGHAGEHYALDRARNAVNALGSLMPRTAQLRRGAELVEVAVESLAVGDVVLARPGDRVAVDGEIVNGASEIDQSPVTGESVPVSKTVGDEVFAGTINHSAALDIRVTRIARDNTLSRVMQLVAEAQSQKSPTQQFADRFTTRFVPAVLVVVLLVIVVPPLLGWMDWEASFYRAMLLLVAASPCALALGTPATVLAGIAQAARNGVLIKGGAHLESLGGLDAIAFDKTGTLTHGKFTLTDTLPLDGVAPEMLLGVAAALEQQSNHPLAQAVVNAARAQGVASCNADGVENIPGMGLRGTLEGKPVLIGTLGLLEANGLPADPALERAVRAMQEKGRSTMVVVHDGRALGALGLADTLRPDIPDTMRRLRALGMRHLVMLTGDNGAVAQRIAADAGLTDVRANLMPEDKLTAIRALQAEYGNIAMVGDGVNDAPALASATVGIAMGGAGTAVALETADIALMADDMGKLPFAVGLSHATRAIIQQNLVIALGVIALLIVTSVLGWVQLSAAVVLHEGSTIVVVLNALRLLGYREGVRGERREVNESERK